MRLLVRVALWVVEHGDVRLRVLMQFVHLVQVAWGGVLRCRNRLPQDETEQDKCAISSEVRDEAPGRREAFGVRGTFVSLPAGARISAQSHGKLPEADAHHLRPYETSHT